MEMEYEGGCVHLTSWSSVEQGDRGTGVWDISGVTEKPWVLMICSDLHTSMEAGRFGFHRTGSVQRRFYGNTML